MFSALDIPVDAQALLDQSRIHSTSVETSNK